LAVFERIAAEGRTGASGMVHGSEVRVLTRDPDGGNPTPM
jgi:hypothetical protein